MASRCEWCEFPFIPDEYQLLEEPIKCVKGKVKALDGPGLGVQINKQMFEENILKI
jgi:L-alanine-DL-glutamate epimerase-like enolase superfamily enzyme